MARPVRREFPTHRPVRLPWMRIGFEDQPTIAIRLTPPQSEGRCNQRKINTFSRYFLAYVPNQLILSCICCASFFLRHPFQDPLPDYNTRFSR
jgi:hypothetical protein